MERQRQEGSSTPAITGMTPSIVKWVPMKPMSTPPPPPISESRTASKRNWATIADRGAPIGLADADLACALGDRDEHDVHHADAADQQRDRRDRTEQRREGARRRPAVDSSVPWLITLNGRSATVVSASWRGCPRPRRRRCRARRSTCLHEQLAEGRGLPGELVLHGGVGRDHDVVWFVTPDRTLFVEDTR